MSSSIGYSSTEVSDNPAKELFAASVARCYTINYDLMLEFAVDDGSPTYSALAIIASKTSIRELVRHSQELNVSGGTSGRWSPDLRRRLLVAAPRRASVFHVSVAGSHSVAIISPAMFDMLSIMVQSGPSSAGPVLFVPAFVSVSLNVNAFADLLADVKECMGGV